MKRILILLCVLLPLQLWGQRFVQSVPNIAALANVNPVSVQSNVWVMGYYAPGDGGEGSFTPTNSVSVTNLGTHVWVGQAGWSWNRNYSGPINVKWFGAKGDGNDDTLAFQSANTSSNSIFIPAGQYRITNSINVVEGSVWYGVGTNSFIDFEGAGRYLFTNTVNSSGDYIGMSRFHQFKEFSVWLGSGTAGGISMMSSWHSIYEHLVFNSDGSGGTNSAIHLYATPIFNIADNVIRNCFVDHISGDGIRYEENVHGSATLTVVGGEYRRCGGAGIWLDTSPAFYGLAFISEANVGYQLYAKSGVVHLEDCYFEGNTTAIPVVKIGDGQSIDGSSIMDCIITSQASPLSAYGLDLSGATSGAGVRVLGNSFPVAYTSNGIKADILTASDLQSEVDTTANTFAIIHNANTIQLKQKLVYGSSTGSTPFDINYSNTLISALRLHNTDAFGGDWYFGENGGSGRFTIYGGTAPANQLVIDATGNLIINGSVRSVATNFISGVNAGLSITNDVIVSGGTTNRMVWSGGILISNIQNFYLP